MPAIGFECRVCNRKFHFDSTATVEGLALMLDHFESGHEGWCIHRERMKGIWMAEFRDTNSPRRNHTSLTASMVMGCIREHCLKRTVPYYVDPYLRIRQHEGSMIHEALPTEDGWHREYAFKETALFGVLISGIADRVHPEKRIVADFKTHKCPSGRWTYVSKEERAAGKQPSFEYYRNVFPPGESEIVQLNILCRLAEIEWPGDPFEAQIKVMQLGVGDTTLSDTLFPVRRMPDAELDEKLNAANRLLYYTMVEPAPTRLKLIGDLPLQGRKMFVSKDGTCKCDRYCDPAIREACDSLLPDAGRDKF